MHVVEFAGCPLGLEFNKRHAGRQWESLLLPDSSGTFLRLRDASCEEGIFISIEHEI